MEIILDVQRLAGPESAHAYLKEMLALPDYYGHNLDALFDCLTEISEETVLCLDGQVADSTFFDKLLKVLQDAAEENPQLRILSRNEEKENAAESGFSYEDAFEDNAEDDSVPVSAEDGE
jgi:ribonuclease inhibitor